MEEAHHASGFQPVSSSLYAGDKQRPRNDVWATVTYAVLGLAVFVGGCVVLAKRDPEVDLHNPWFFTNSTTCDPQTFDRAWSQLYPAKKVDNAFTPSFHTALAIWLPITALVGMVTGAIYVFLFRHHATAMVNITVVVATVGSAAFGIFMIVAGAMGGGIILLIVAVILGICFWFMREDLKLCASLLSVAGRGLQENGWLIPTALVLKVAGLAIMGWTIATLAVASQIGTVSYASTVATITPSNTTGLGSEIGVCTDAYGIKVDCCQWNPSAGTGFLIFLCAVMIMWTTQIVMQLKLYIVADTIAQWYWMPAGAFNNSPERPSVRKAVKHALTSGFGSISMAAAILMLIRMVRDALQRQARNNIICCLINCLAQPILAMLEQFTRFATIACAITGNKFTVAAKDIFHVLKRNFLATYSLWWVPDFVTGCIVLLASLCWSGVVFLITFLSLRSKDDDIVQFGVSFATAACSLGVMFWILSFISNLVMDIVNTAYICWSMDRDAKRQTRPDIGLIYESIPTLQGAVVEQPGGEVNYGRVEDPPMTGHAYPPQGSNPSPYAYSGTVAMQPLYGAQPYSASPYPGPPQQYGQVNNYPPITSYPAMYPQQQGHQGQGGNKI